MIDKQLVSKGNIERATPNAGVISRHNSFNKQAAYVSKAPTTNNKT